MLKIIMGAKSCMLAFCDGQPKHILRTKPEIDRAKSKQIAQSLFPSRELESMRDRDLSDLYPLENEILVGCYPGLTIVVSEEFAADYPSKMAASYLSLDARPFVYFHAMHSIVDWFAYAVWEKGILKRSLSLSPGFGIIEDIGERQPFEQPYWSGLYPVDNTWDDDTEYPFPFHPLELGEATLLELLGYEIEGSINSWQIDPGHFPLVAFKQKKRQKRF